MIELLDKAIGMEVVVDYRTTGRELTFAKGILQSVEGTKICVVNSHRIWMLDEASIVNIRVTTDKRPAGVSYKDGSVEQARLNDDEAI